MTEDTTMSEADEAALVVEGASSGLEYLLHPLVLINISDHCLRSKLANGGAFQRVVGCLLGRHAGRTVDVINSFEMLEGAAPGGAPTFDHDVYGLKLEQYQEVFKDLDVIGWYATGGSLQAPHLALHKKVAELVEAPILLMMDPNATMAIGVKELPLTLYESELKEAISAGVHIVNDQPETRFVKVTYAMASSDAERIGVNSAAEVSTGASGENSALARHYSGLHGSLSMFTERIEMLHSVLQQMEAGSIPLNHQVLRMVSGLLSRFPSTPDQELSHELVNECTDTTLVNMLCLVTRGVSEAQQLVDAANIAYVRKSG